MKRCFFIVLMILVSCKKEVIPDPEPAVLLGPENNNSCNTAVRISDQKSQVNFNWQTALHADKYELVIRDILTNVDQKKETIRLYSSVVLDRAKQYAWWVNSKSEQTETVTKSEVWTFYLEGTQTLSHFPFSAKLVSPKNNAKIRLENGALTLVWEAVDLDGDIESYDVYIGAGPDDLILAAENLTSNSITASLDSDQSYYWKVLTRDQEGNISQSPVGYFKTSL